MVFFNLGENDMLIKNITLLEEKNKKLYLDMYENIGLELNKYEIGYNQRNQEEMKERAKEEKRKESKEQTKSEFKYKLGKYILLILF